jgi:TonB family protein
MRRTTLLLLMFGVLACGTPVEPPAPLPPRNRWWVRTCGNVDPLGVMAGGHAIVPPALLQRVEPKWPPDVRGVVIVETVLTDRGTVCAARVLRGISPGLDDAAIAAVKQWTFTPVILNGQPRYGFFNVTVAVH